MSAPRLVGFALIGARAAAGSTPWRRTWPSPELAKRTGNPNARTLNRPRCPHDGDIAADGACLDCGLTLPRRALHGVRVPAEAARR